MTASRSTRRSHRSGRGSVGLLIDIVVLIVLCLPGLARPDARFRCADDRARCGPDVRRVLRGDRAVRARCVAAEANPFGNRLTNTHVVDARNGHFISAGDAGTRYVLRMLISMILFIGFLVALGNSQRRTFHDNVAGTVVIRPPRASWSIDDEMAP